MPKNTYASRLKQAQARREMIVKLWTAQLCLDAMTLVLNDPAVMGKDTFGATRIKKVGDAFSEKFAEIYPALTKDVEADYLRDKLDEALKKINGDGFPAWSDRYEGWQE